MIKSSVIMINFCSSENTHLVNWKLIMRNEGCGLSIRNTKYMNPALVAKSSWMFIREERTLWTKTVLSKYLEGIQA